MKKQPDHDIKDDAFDPELIERRIRNIDIEHEMKKYLNIAVDVDLKEHGTLPRFEGKAKRVIDNRVM